MKTIKHFIFVLCNLVVVGLAQELVAEDATARAAGVSQTVDPKVVPIPPEQIGRAAGKQYSGDGLAVVATQDGALVRCAFQCLKGRATVEGLWLTSAVDGAGGEPFRVMARGLGRGGGECGAAVAQNLAGSGRVEVVEGVVHFIRPGLTEEYSVSIDGVRQDFVLTERPAGDGQMRVELDVCGARVEPLVDGVRLVLADGGRKLNYGRLQALDASGRQLTAKLEVLADNRLAVRLDDRGAQYPVRIDPTFSDENWISMGGIPGANGLVYAMAVDSSGNLYIGGDFTVAGNTIVNHIAKWNGSGWSALGLGMNGWVDALVVSGTNLYVGGDFTAATNSGGTAIAANYAAKWDGSSWSALGSGMDGSVRALVVSGSDLYAGGYFTTATNSGGTTIAANYVAKWDGSGWSALGSGMNGAVSALAVSGSNVFVGGFFTTAGANPAKYIAKWDGSGWSALGSGMDKAVYALATSGNNVYAGGAFMLAGGHMAYLIAKWDGSNWSALGMGIGGVDDYVSVNALAVSGGVVYAGGRFTTAGGTTANYIAKWNGSSWSTLGSGVSYTVYALAVSGSVVYAGGYFTTAGSRAANYVAKWNGSSWSALGSGMNDGVSALAVSGSVVYAGGRFTTAGGGEAKYIAKWNGSSWSALGSGLNYYVYALAVLGGNVYAGGEFSTAGGIPAFGIAKWNGSSWSALGAGLDGFVYALAVSGNDLYVGGGFLTAGGSPANSIAKWNGSSWSALGSGVGVDIYEGWVYALATSGSDVYAGGSFTTAGGNPANSIAKWNGSSWSKLGSGMDGSVYALAVSGSDLYASGEFTTAGGAAATNVAKWNGSSWSKLGSGMDGSVNALAVSGSDLYAGGGFITAGGGAANYIARWNGSSWSALGSGMDSSVNALAVSGSDLYAGGDFITAGGKVSGHVAKANLAGTPISIVSTNAAFGFTNGTFGFDVSGPTGSNVVIQASTNLQTWIPLQTNMLESGLLYFSDSQSSTNRQRFYRAQLLP